MLMFLRFDQGGSYIVLGRHKIVSTHAMLLVSIFPQRSDCSIPPTLFLRHARFRWFASMLRALFIDFQQNGGIAANDFAHKRRLTLSTKTSFLSSLQSIWIHRPDGQTPSVNVS